MKSPAEHAPRPAANDNAPTPSRAPDLRILSCGGGFQSSALALMSFAGALDPLDAVIFSDTGHEMPETYAYLDDVLRPAAERAGVPFVVVRGRVDLLTAALSDRSGRPTLPVRLRHPDGSLSRQNGYTCSFDYKRRLVTAEVRRRAGARGAWRRANVEQWIGYSRDEASRMKAAEECRCGHNRTVRHGQDVALIHTVAGGCSRCDCTAFDPWQVNRWPLIELRMTRADCRRWILAHGYPAPPRSACYFCPNRGNEHWRDLRDNYPDLWSNALALDEAVRRHPRLRLDGYLHQSGQPLADVDLTPREDPQLALFDLDAEAECSAGSCFT